MSAADDTIRGLRDALEFSPNNIPLRLHLAKTMLGFGRFEESEQEYRQALALAPNNDDIKMELAKLYLKLGKNSQALVIIEVLCRQQNPSAEALVVYSKLLIAEGNIASAVAQYKLAIETSPDCADPELSEKLGIGVEYQDGDVFEGRHREPIDPSRNNPEAEIERPKISFSDVGGMEGVKEEVAIKILYPLKHPEMYAAYGKTIGGGILMYGPPGCGKTYLARATAGEIGAGFISVGISDVLDMWTGQSERNLSSLFEQARRNAPCVLFFDEVDALGGRRSDMQSGSSRQLINQFLSEMDGVEKSNEGVLILAATNAPWHVDPAFRRPGRFDRVLFVPPPDDTGLISILKIHLKEKPQGTIDCAKVSRYMKGYSGADIKAVVDLTIENKLRESLKSGTVSPIQSNDLITATKVIRATTNEWFSTAKNYATYSNQGGVYDDVLKYLKK